MRERKGVRQRAEGEFSRKSLEPRKDTDEIETHMQKASVIRSGRS
jgi:hypothetical protein